ncbi:MAG: RNA polymerase sigma factor RpoD/SigA [Nitrospinae bacterium]|nr:RNA polymerase sigma factor RpoD/SigA [Nitrospinota bacterium]MBF0633788.1 RNA polymerase sigma factor RpoD/SigA [Nitrospinota bacterium]
MMTIKADIEDSLKAYLRDIRGLNPLTRDEEMELAKDGGKEALQKLVERNLKYVVLVANRYKGMGMSMSDLVNEGNIGMLTAANRFKSEKGVKFITYASWWVRQSIMRALAEQARVVRLPLKQAGLLSRITKAVEALTQELHREPRVDEVARRLRIKLSTLEIILRVYRDYVSLDSPISDDNRQSYMDILQPEDGISVEEDFIRLCMHHDMAKLLDELPQRDAAVLRMRYGFDEPPMTLEEIGKKLKLTRERVRQIEKAAKKALRMKTKVRILEDYLR